MPRVSSPREADMRQNAWDLRGVQHLGCMSAGPERAKMGQAMRRRSLIWQAMPCKVGRWNSDWVHVVAGLPGGLERLSIDADKGMELESDLRDENKSQQAGDSAYR
jgi:hypothetical protein